MYGKWFVKLKLRVTQDNFIYIFLCRICGWNRFLLALLISFCVCIVYIFCLQWGKTLIFQLYYKFFEYFISGSLISTHILKRISIFFLYSFRGLRRPNFKENSQLICYRRDTVENFSTNNYYASIFAKCILLWCWLLMCYFSRKLNRRRVLIVSLFDKFMNSFVLPKYVKNTSNFI